MAFEIRCMCRVLLVRGTRLKNEENMRVSRISQVFHDRGVYRVGVVWSRFPSIPFSLVSQKTWLIPFPSVFSSMIIFTNGFWNSESWQGTVSSRLTLKERGIHSRFPVFILGVYFHWSLLKFGVWAEYRWLSAHALRTRYTRCSVSLHAACCDENASGHHHYNKMQVSDGNY